VQENTCCDRAEIDESVRLGLRLFCFVAWKIVS